MNALDLHEVGIGATDTYSAGVGVGEDRSLPLGTAWMAVILGLRRPERGTVRIAGVDAHGPPEQIRSRLAVTACVGGPVGLIANLSVRDNVALPLRYHRRLADRDVAARVDALLVRFGWADRGRAPGHALSELERRDVQALRALATEPDLLLLDSRGGPIEYALTDLVRSRGTIVRFMGHA